MHLLAVSAYSAGELVGGLLPLLLGVALILLGVRRRRASTAAAPGWGFPASSPDPVPAPSWTPAAPDSEGAPLTSPNPMPTPDRPRGTGLVVGGALLVVLALLGGVLVAVTRQANERRVELPSSVLGLARDQAASAQVGKQALTGIPRGLVEPQAAIYGTLPNAVLVIAARAHTSAPSSQLEGFRKGLEKSGGQLRNGRDVDTGPLGGAARCWEGVISTIRPGVCIFVDRGSLVATIDFLGGGIPAAAKRGLQIREATVHKA